MDTVLSKLRALNLAEPIAVVGMGVSGSAALDILREAGYDAIGFDERKSGPHIEQVSFDASIFTAFSTLVISPGVDRRRRAFQETFAQCVNDVELFARVVDKPVVAVTGSNGKSTVVSLLSEALQALGHRVSLCGNIGRSVLEALLETDHDTDYYVLELSSYQLELCPSLTPGVGAVLNVTPDHLDRYASFAEYFAAKANLAHQSQVVVLNADDRYCREMGEQALNPIYFGGKKVESNRVDEQWIYLNDQRLLETPSLALTGQHNHRNVLCVLLILQALGESIDAALPTIKRYPGLAHRMQLVREVAGVRWVNDSKATNIGATAAALMGLHEPVILIAGGLGKQQDFTELADVIATSSVREVLLIGQDSDSIAHVFDSAFSTSSDNTTNTVLKDATDNVNIQYKKCQTLDNAIQQAASLAERGDVVLLSPACASFDQFAGFAERGECFATLVSKL